jgi:UDP-glucose 4-epimerase
MPRVVVTGGCGFIGANLAALLREQRHDVVIVDNLSCGNPAYLDDAGAYTLIKADIRDGAALDRALAGADAIIHLAAYGSVVDSVADPAENYSINVEGTFSLLSAARRAGVRRCVFSSTGGALIGDAIPPVSEASVPRPISPYGASKLAGEGYCCAFAHSYDMSITALRFANVVGPLSWHKKGAVTAFFKAIMGEQPIRIYGDGSATRDYLYVGDLCRGISAALDADLPGFNALHLASGREVSVKELARIACAAAGAPEHPIVFDARRKGEVERNFASYALAEKTLGFRPRVPLEEAVRLTWEWFNRHAQRVRARA